MMSIFDRVLITGGGGMLAKALALSLRMRNIEPVTLARDEIDVTNLGDLNKLFHMPATMILNCAAYTKVDLAEEQEETAQDVNAYAVGELANGCRIGGKKFVHFSTDFVFDGRSSNPHRPTDATNPLSAYGRSKLGGEQCALDHLRYGGDVLIIRTAWLYGPGGPNFVQTMLNAARAGKPLKVVNDQTGSPTFTHDLAEATLNLIDAGARGIFHVTNSGQTTWFDFTRAILEEFDLKADLSPVTSAEWKQLRPNSATRPMYSVLDCSDYERVTGKTLPHWRDALHRYRLALSSD